MAALNAARFRRDRVENLAVATGTGGGSKRKTVPRKVGDTVSSTASTTASTEKVSPDPKHIRTGETAPEPKQLFASPVEPSEPPPCGDGRGLVESEGGVCVRYVSIITRICAQSFVVLPILFRKENDQVMISSLLRYIALPRARPKAFAWDE